MSKWLTKAGLTAIFKDVAMTPVNLSRAVFEEDCYKTRPAAARRMAVAVHAPALLNGVAVALAASPLAGIATYYAMTNVFMGSCAIAAQASRRSFFPAMTKHALKKPSHLNL